MVRVSRVGVAATVFAVVITITACGSRTPVGTRPTSTATETISAASASSGAANASPSSSRRPSGLSSSRGLAGAVPRFDHIVVVVEENKPYGDLVGTPATPFLTSLASSGVVLTQSYGIGHPSEPNYLALFSGSTQGLENDSCPHQFSGANLAASLIAAGETFVGYAESLPSTGYLGCSAGDYARKHAPWTNFALPATVNQPMTAFPTDYAKLPTVSFVVPNLEDDMHDGSVAEGDQWLASHLSQYRTWAVTHNSLLVITTDEDDSSHANHITTIMAGAHIKSGRYVNRVDHYGLLRTLLASFSLTPFAAAATSSPITGMWST